MSYDARHRVVERRVERDGFQPKLWRYGWDAQDRLVSCETPSGERWVYGYDPFGRRVSKCRVLSEAEQVWVRGRFPSLVQPVSAGGRSALDVWAARPTGASETDALPPVVGVAYLWDGDVVAEEAPLRLDGGIDWDEATRWHYEPGGFVPLAKEAPDGSLGYIVTDHLGTPREVFGEDGALVWAAEYRTWGQVRRLWVAEADNDNRAVSRGGSFPGGGGGCGGRTFGALALKDDPEAIAASQVCPIRFQGQWEDQETGLNYNRFRHYDGLIGHYASSDPIGFEGGIWPTGYVLDPRCWIDPLGLAGQSPLPPSPTGKGAVGEIRGPNIPGGTESGLSTQAGGGGIQNPSVAEAYDQVPENKRSFYHGKCCEADALSKLANWTGAKSVDDLRKRTEGSEFKAYNSKGSYLPACSSCRRALNYLGIK